MGCFWCLYVKIWQKKDGEIFADSEKVTTFAPAMRSKRPLKHKQRFWKSFLKNLAKKIWRFEKLALPLHPLSPQKRKQRSEKKFEKSCKKIWWLRKKVLPLHHFPLWKSGQARRLERAFRWTRNVLIAIYEQRSLKLLSSKVFIHSKEWFQTIPLRLELKI